MTVYYGVVKDHRVELEDNTPLSEGERVEVRPVVLEAASVDAGGTNAADAERALAQDLLVAGLLDQLPTDEVAPDEPFEPVTVRGRPLSEHIMEERR